MGRHFFDAWLKSLPVIQHGKYEVRPIVGWDQTNSPPYEWTDEQIWLFRLLVRPEREDLRAFLEGLEKGSYGSDLSEEAKGRIRRAWKTPVASLVAGSKTILTGRRRCSFQVTFDIDRWVGMSGSWGWAVRPLTTRYAVVLEADEARMEEMPSGLGWMPLGLVAGANPVAAVALLFSDRAKNTRPGTVFELEELGCASSIRTRLKSIDVYRLLLAYCGHGGRGVVDMSDSDLIGYREAGMGCGFEAVASIM